MHLWLNFHPNYHHASSSISRVTNFSKMHLIQQTTIIIHGTHIISYFHLELIAQSGCNGSWLLECPILTGRYHWYFPGRYQEYVLNIPTARLREYFPYRCSIRDWDIHYNEIVFQTNKLSTSESDTVLKQQRA